MWPRRWQCFPTTLMVLLLAKAGAFAADAKESMGALLQRYQSVLSDVKAYEIEGTVEAVFSDRLLEVMGAKDPEDKIRGFRFHTRSKGASLMAEFVQTKGTGNQSEKCYNDAEKVVSVGASGIANVTSKKVKGRENLGVRDLSPAFMEYAFLQRTIDISGVRAAPPASLHDLANWKEVKGRATVTLDNPVQFTIERTDGGTIVELTALEAPTAGLWPRKITFLDKEGAQVRIVEVIDRIADPILGSRPKTVRLTSFLPLGNPGESIMAAVWEFRIARFIVNPPIEESDLLWDPASADSIWDTDNKTMITVPR